MNNKSPTNSIIFSSRALGEVIKLARRVAPSFSTVLITGESGTGKDLIAQAIHEASPQRDRPFVPVNVAAIPPLLIESHLFGHLRGSFTGAEHARDGVFRTAENGSLFLDEIGELPITLQPKLLRALEQKEVMPVGADRPIRVHTRIIAATDRDLRAMVDDGRFREDLFYRLNVINIHIPPLRSRPEDIPLLAKYYVSHYCHLLDRPELDIAGHAMRCLLAHRWKGNVRELAHAIEGAVLMCDGDMLHAKDFPPEIGNPRILPPDDLNMAVLAFKRRHILSVLESVDYQREAAAKALGISQSTLYRQLSSLGLSESRCMSVYSS